MTVDIDIFIVKKTLEEVEEMLKVLVKDKQLIVSFESLNHETQAIYNFNEGTVQFYSYHNYNPCYSYQNIQKAPITTANMASKLIVIGKENQKQIKQILELIKKYRDKIRIVESEVQTQTELLLAYVHFEGNYKWFNVLLEYKDENVKIYIITTKLTTAQVKQDVKVIKTYRISNNPEENILNILEMLQKVYNLYIDVLKEHQASWYNYRFEITENLENLINKQLIDLINFCS